MSKIKKNIKYINIFIISTFLFACAPKSQIKAKPLMEKIDNISIDWEQVREDLESNLNENEEYPKSYYTDFSVNEETKTIRLIWVLKDEATQVDALIYAPILIKNFNDYVATQDFSIDRSEDDFYGGLWNRYNMELELFRNSDILEESKYLVNQIIDKGAYDAIIPQIIGE